MSSKSWQENAHKLAITWPQLYLKGPVVLSAAQQRCWKVSFRINPATTENRHIEARFPLPYSTCSKRVIGGAAAASTCVVDKTSGNDSKLLQSAAKTRKGIAGRSSSSGYTSHQACRSSSSSWEKSCISIRGGWSSSSSSSRELAGFTAPRLQLLPSPMVQVARLTTSQPAGVSISDFFKRPMF